MREPVGTTSRPIIVRLLLIAFVLVLSACGNSDGGRPSAPQASASVSPTAAQAVGECASGDAALRAARKIGVADLGLGEAQVALTAPGGPCPDTVFTQAPQGTAYVRLGYRPATVRLIQVGDVRMVAVRQDHPRGGFQEHLYAVRGTELGEITRNGNPILPFAALDVAGEPHASADCSGGGLRVLEAAPTQPRGVLVGWDVFATSYTFADGGIATRSRQRIAHSVPDPRIEKAHPELFSDVWFSNCS